ncbi:hypothetical protein TrCOL_g1581 [Triparma columacea]|uniref:Uncharacterized protein n=1 Tax=Triparma columacea TaxID=722753 RepID=A0A9W7GH36_9STRA|nr:hypothetical protein TrCOL_g1581 [Triparma columacea]
MSITSSHSTPSPPSHNLPDASASEENNAISAAATRGTTKALFRNTVLRTRTVASKTTSKTVSRLGVGRLPVKQLAKVADKTATGLDLKDSFDIDELKKAKSLRGRLSSISGGVKEFARVGFLGIVAWEGYDTLMDIGVKNLYPNRKDNNAPHELAFAAGFVAGSAHALASLGLDFSLSSLPKFPAYRLFSHGIAHSVLFGVYDLGVGMGLSEEGTEGRVTAEHVLGVGLIGGTAGVASQVASSLTENMENVGWGTKGRPPIPGVRHMMTGAFLPSALAFVAFEYGKDIYGGE